MKMKLETLRTELIKGLSDLYDVETGITEMNGKTNPTGEYNDKYFLPRIYEPIIINDRLYIEISYINGTLVITFCRVLHGYILILNSLFADFDLLGYSKAGILMRVATEVNRNLTHFFKKEV